MPLLAKVGRYHTFSKVKGSEISESGVEGVEGADASVDSGE